MSYVIESPAAVARLQRPLLVLSYRSVGVIAAIIDCILIVVASVATGVSYHLWTLGVVGDVQGYAGIGTNAACLFVLLAKTQGMYRPVAILWARQLSKIALSWSAVLLVIIALLFLLKLSQSYSRGATIGLGVLGLGLLISSRVVMSNALRRVMARGGIVGQRAMVLGELSELGHYPADELLLRYGIREVGRFELPAMGGDAQAVISEVRAVLRAAFNAAQMNRVEIVLLALRWTDALHRNVVRECLRALPLPVFLLPDRSVGSILVRPVVQMGSDSAVELQRAPLGRLEQVTKRAFDILVAGGILVLVSPLLLLISIAVKLHTRGSVIFRQGRKGFNGREFTIYKFRTMTVSEDGAAVRQARPYDARVTDLGYFLRASSIDELPQLINVLRGEMSLVGPRPHAIAHDDQYCKAISNYAFRYHVKPGITGWAQVNGLRGETERVELMERRVDLDLWYINNWSVWLDVWILIRTCTALPRNASAY